jgi:hypothetical protein
MISDGDTVLLPLNGMCGDVNLDLTVVVHIRWEVSVLQSDFGGLVVSMLASGTQLRGFNLGRSNRIFRAENSSACLPSEGK